MQESAGVTGPWLFSAKQRHAVDLAVLRIVVFGLMATWTELPRIAWFARLPDELVFPPTGSTGIVELIPVTPTVVTVAGIAFFVASVMAAVGLFTRSSASIAVLLGLFVMLVPQLYGKVNHYHHLVWFGAILAVSPCGDALSVDAWRSNRDLGLRREQSAAYYWPLAAVWVLMGIIYLFPGVWKLAVAGPEWALSENLQLQMYAKWYELEGWEPLFRLDRHPLLYRGAGLYVMAFETCFLALVVHDRTRRWAAQAGVLFHVATGLFMQIWFGTLLLCYVSFVEWNRLWARIGDWRNSAPIEGSSAAGDGRSSPSVRIAIVFALLAAGNIGFGFFGIVQGWPFASYPVFVPPRTQPEVARLQLSIHEDSASVGEQVSLREFKRQMGPPRYSMLVERLIFMEPPARRARKLRSFAEVAMRESGTRIDGGRMRSYAVRVSILPRDDGRVLDRRLLHEWSVDPTPTEALTSTQPPFDPD